MRKERHSLSWDGVSRIYFDSRFLEGAACLSCIAIAAILLRRTPSAEAASSVPALLAMYGGGALLVAGIGLLWGRAGAR
ncbi:MAG TPA: hypothetical protein VLH09_03105, partial [Bryobacteraceae bacterium]|nr:hypothetical protein [Bryobacteraceae bacterium]